MQPSMYYKEEAQSISNHYRRGINDASTHSAANPKKTLLPGCGRPLNYIPKKYDPGYVGELFKNALSSVDIEEHEIAYVFLHFIRYDFEQRVFGLGCL
jgi:hypothetical protein